jgi:hypothetical protein
MATASRFKEALLVLLTTSLLIGATMAIPDQIYPDYQYGQLSWSPPFDGDYPASWSYEICIDLYDQNNLPTTCQTVAADSLELDQNGYPVYTPSTSFYNIVEGSQHGVTVVAINSQGEKGMPYSGVYFDYQEPPCGDCFDTCTEAPTDCTSLEQFLGVGGCTNSCLDTQERLERYITNSETKQALFRLSVHYRHGRSTPSRMISTRASSPASCRGLFHRAARSHHITFVLARATRAPSQIMKTTTGTSTCSCVETAGDPGHPRRL